MKKRVQALLLAFVMVFATIASPLMDAVSVDAAEDSLEVKFHYNREDGNYDNWYLYSWNGQNSGDIEFQDVDGEKVATVVAGSAASIGYIVKTGLGWDNTVKDWDGDRTVDVSGYVSGEIHVYIESGVEAVTIDYSKAVAKTEDSDKSETDVPETDVPETDTNESLKIKFHYNREDGNYDNWAMWIWDDIETPAVNPFFEEEDGEMTVTYEVKENATKVGYIVKTGDGWAGDTQKDFSDDRFIDVTAYKSGIIHVYIESGVGEVTEDYSAARKDLTIKFYYNREDGNYDNWAMWIWDDSGNDAINPFFEEEDGKMVVTFDVAANSTYVGYIVKTGADWNNASKDWDGDRLIDLNKYVYGTVRVYIESGVEAVEVDESDVLTADRVTKATYNEDDNAIAVVTTLAVEDFENAFTVKCGEDEVKVTAVKKDDASETTYILALEEKIDLSKSYTVIYSTFPPAKPI